MKKKEQELEEMAKKAVDNAIPDNSNSGKPNYYLTTSFNSKMWNKFVNQTFGTFYTAYKDGFPDRIVDMITWMDTAEEVDNFVATQELPDHYHFTPLDHLAEFVNFARLYDGGVPFKERGIDPDKIADGSKFRFNYMPFAKKVYSWGATYMNLKEGDYLVWLDADIILHRSFDAEYLDAVANGFDIIFLDRDWPWYAGETGFFMLRKCPAVDQFVQFILHAYSSGFIFDMSEWHDGYIFKTSMKLLTGSDVKILNLNRCLKERDVFDRTILADCMTHYKGNTKKQFQQNQMMDDEPETVINYDPENQ
jgi:hypothetical protein